jgi:2-iminobutanoate/2-iminopropanoate deaminase
MSIKKEVVLTSKSPAPIGPYSQAIKVQGSFGMMFVSGQIPMNPVSGQIEVHDVSAQTGVALENLKAVVEAGGATLGRIVKTTIFLKSMGDFPKVNEVYAKYFVENPPARSTVEVARLPRDVLVEIEAIVVL